MISTDSYFFALTRIREVNAVNHAQGHLDTPEGRRDFGVAFLEGVGFTPEVCDAMIEYLVETSGGELADESEIGRFLVAIWIGVQAAMHQVGEL